MMDIKLLPIDDGRIINLNQIVEIERFDALQLENDDGTMETLVGGAIIKMHNDSEIILNAEDANTIFQHAFEQLDILNQLKEKMGV